jgi:hypothetical protein
LVFLRHLEGLVEEWVQLLEELLVDPELVE